MTLTTDEMTDDEKPEEKPEDAQGLDESVDADCRSGATKPERVRRESRYRGSTTAEVVATSTACGCSRRRLRRRPGGLGNPGLEAVATTGADPCRPAGTGGRRHLCADLDEHRLQQGRRELQPGSRRRDRRVQGHVFEVQHPTPPTAHRQQGHGPRRRRGVGDPVRDQGQGRGAPVRRPVGLEHQRSRSADRPQPDQDDHGVRRRSLAGKSKSNCPDDRRNRHADEHGSRRGGRDRGRNRHRPHRRRRRPRRSATSWAASGTVSTVTPRCIRSAMRCATSRWPSPPNWSTTPSRDPWCASI